MTEAFLFAIRLYFFLNFRAFLFLPLNTGPARQCAPPPLQKSLLSRVRPRCSCLSFFGPFDLWRCLRLLSVTRSASPFLTSPAPPARLKRKIFCARVLRPWSVSRLTCAHLASRACTRACTRACILLHGRGLDNLLVDLTGCCCRNRRRLLFLLLMTLTMTTQQQPAAAESFIFLLLCPLRFILCRLPLSPPLASSFSSRMQTEFQK